MLTRSLLLTCFLTCFLSLTALAGPNWPAFRGDGTSLTTARDLPLKWSAEESAS